MMDSGYQEEEEPRLIIIESKPTQQPKPSKEDKANEADEADKVDKSNLKCIKCTKRFRDLTSYYNHRKRCGLISKYYCPECGTKNSSKHSLNYHIRMTHCKHLKCRICDKLFSRKTTLNIHMNIHTGKKPFACHLCNACFADPSNLNQHKKRHNNNSFKRYECPHCLKTFSRNYYLNLHIRKKHPEHAC